MGKLVPVTIIGITVSTPSSLCVEIVFFGRTDDFGIKIGCKNGISWSQLKDAEQSASPGRLQVDVSDFYTHPVFLPITTTVSTGLISGV